MATLRMSQTVRTWRLVTSEMSRRLCSIILCYTAVAILTCLVWMFLGCVMPHLTLLHRVKTNMMPSRMMGNPSRVGSLGGDLIKRSYSNQHRARTKKCACCRKGELRVDDLTRLAHTSATQFARSPVALPQRQPRQLPSEQL